jgi:hypothetical protein
MSRTLFEHPRHADRAARERITGGRFSGQGCLDAALVAAEQACIAQCTGTPALQCSISSSELTFSVDRVHLPAQPSRAVAERDGASVFG